MFDRGLGLVSAGPAGRENLLSLIPCLIKRCAGCLAGGVWVWLGGTLLLFGSDMSVRFRVAGGELAHCWVLRRHLCGVFLVDHSWPGWPNASWLPCVGGCGCGGGVVVRGVVVC